MCYVVVIDGVTVGFCCCGIHNCHTALASNRHRFCPDHVDRNLICAIVDCEEPVMEGRLACANEKHQEVENLHHARGQSRFQLKDRLARANVAHPNDLVAEEINLEELVDDEVFEGEVDEPQQEDIPSTEEDKPKKIRAQFGRKRTHNEQIIVAPCGIIIARETFYGAEAVSSVVEMVKRVYRMGGTMPNHIFFDNNCQLAKIVKDDPDFANVGLSVDVFHFKAKHKETDTFCQQNCNPVAFPELLGEDGKAWYFNSSIAEQTNVWLGGYHAICREMLVDKYTFFLDKMIFRKNQLTMAKLIKTGKEPGYWPAL